MNRYTIFLLLLISVGLLPLTVHGQGVKQVSRLAIPSVRGSWSLFLTRYAGQEPRILDFSQAGNVISGTYMTKTGQRLSISSARISNGVFYFRVADLKLYFEMRFVGPRLLDGKMTDYGSKVKKPADPVRMERRG